MIEKKPVKEEFKEEPEKIITGKGKKFESCYKSLQEAKLALDSSDIERAKKLYIETRNLYMELDSTEKKEIYDELMELYNKLSGSS